MPNHGMVCRYLPSSEDKWQPKVTNGFVVPVSCPAVYGSQRELKRREGYVVFILLILRGGT